MVAFNELRINPDDTPPPDVLAWCENLVRTIKDGGVWGIPRSGTMFRVDHTNKRLVCTSLGFVDDGDFLATKQNFAHIGWDVVMESENDNAQKKTDR